MARVNLRTDRKVVAAHNAANPYLRRTAELIWGGARQLVPKGSGLSGSGKSAYVNGRRPIFSTLRIDGDAKALRTTFRVGSPVNHAATVHQGSEMHTIRSENKTLKFAWVRGNLLVQARASGRLRGRGRSRRLRPRNGFFFFESVQHSGNKRPVRYLTTPMHLFGRMRGFRTRSFAVPRSRLP